MAVHAYVSRRVLIDPEVARQRLAEWIRCPDLPASPAAVMSTFARFWPVGGLTPERMDCLFAVRGLLWVAIYPVRVRLECTLWSQSECELGLRPAYLRWPVGGRRYFREAAALLGEIRESLVAGEPGSVFAGSSGGPSVERVAA